MGSLDVKTDVDDDFQSAESASSASSSPASVKKNRNHQKQQQQQQLQQSGSLRRQVKPRPLRRLRPSAPPPLSLSFLFFFSLRTRPTRSALVLLLPTSSPWGTCVVDLNEAEKETLLRETFLAFNACHDWLLRQNKKQSNTVL